MTKMAMEIGEMMIMIIMIMMIACLALVHHLGTIGLGSIALPKTRMVMRKRQ